MASDWDFRTPRSAMSHSSASVPILTALWTCPGTEGFWENTG